MKKIVSALLLAVAATIPTQSFATPISVDATLTTDNHYGLYHGKGNSLTFVGRNELGFSGSTGGYNWSLPESFSFTADTNEYLYIVAWSDDDVAQGTLGQFVLSNGNTLLTDTTNWEVAIGNNNLGDGSELPAFATLDDLSYGQINFSLSNGSAPWGFIPGVSADALWIWGAPLTPGSGYGESMVFRTKLGGDGQEVPEPASMVLLASGVLIGLRRKRA